MSSAQGDEVREMMEELIIKGGWVSPLPASPKKRGKRRGRSSDRKWEMGGGGGGRGGTKRVMGEKGAVGEESPVSSGIGILFGNREVKVEGTLEDIRRGRDSSAGAIAGLMACHGVVDGGLHTAPMMAGPTWRNSRGVERRLDYIFLSRSLGQLSRRLLPVFLSDHDGVLLHVGGYWKLEREVLDEQAFVNCFVDFFRGLEGLRSMCEGVLEWWEIAKVRIRVFIIGYCKKKKREERTEVDHIQRLLELELEAGNLGGSVDWERSSALKAQLRELHEQKARAFLERAHSGFLEHDETCSAVFFKSVRGRQSRKVMYGVSEENGRVVRETEEMVKVTTEHFRGFFQERAVDVEQGNVFLEHLSRRVPEDIREAMEAQISLEEVESALRSMGKGKVPEMDGLPTEINLTTRARLGPLLSLGNSPERRERFSIMLGVLFETSGSATLNWNRSIAVVQRKLGMWMSRLLSFIGKVLVLKVDVLPSLLYMAYVYPLAASLRRPLVRLVFQFMWGGRLEYVVRVCMLWELAHPVIHPSGYFLRVFFSYQARSVMVWSNTGPRAEQLPGLRAYPEVEVARVGLDHRHLFEEVRQGGCPGPIVGIPAGVWEGVQVCGLDNGLNGRGMTQSPTCPRPTCGGEETLFHVFWVCAFAGVVWARAQVLIGRVRGDFVVTWARVERGVGKASGTVRDRFLLWLLISLFKRGLWEARQKMERTGREGGVEGIVRRVEQNLRGRMKRKERKWGQNAARERWKGGLGLGLV
ncbi:unnamed protein product [Coregonus sp. 'balchen']|nr:unnamed protein product [Coregonus sp. 'balchen']